MTPPAKTSAPQVFTATPARASVQKTRPIGLPPTASRRNRYGVQFGYRFSLDYTPYLFLLLAVGGRPMGRVFWTIALAGVAVNTWGALVFAGGVN